jgi:hypothetical protein
MLRDFCLKGTFGLLFFAVVRFSPPSQEDEVVRRKAKAKNNSPESQESIFGSLLGADGRSRRPRQVKSAQAAVTEKCETIS